MLKQATVSDLIMDRVSRAKGHVVITMRRYPRFINRELRDEYLTCMSPDWPLFEDWLAAKRRHQDHDGAFARARFEQRFDVNDDGLRHLARLSALAAERDVYLVCQCQTGHRCHREFLLILARRLFKANAEKPKNDYGIFEKRIPEFRKRLRHAACSLPPDKEKKKNDQKHPQVQAVVAQRRPRRRPRAAGDDHPRPRR